MFFTKIELEVRANKPEVEVALNVERFLKSRAWTWTHESSDE